jgi:hypothetical protein
MHSVALRIRLVSAIAYLNVMDWMTIRLELAATEGFAHGSAGRAFLLRVPLDNQGHIDADALARSPTRASVSRFWASEPDEYGKIEQADGSWIFRSHSRKNGEAVFRLESPLFQLGGQVTIEDPEGQKLPFRVTSVRGLGAKAARP